MDGTAAYQNFLCYADSHLGLNPFSLSSDNRSGGLIALLSVVLYP